MAREHECERDVVIAPASGDEWYEEYRITKDGALNPFYVGESS